MDSICQVLIKDDKILKLHQRKFVWVTIGKDEVLVGELHLVPLEEALMATRSMPTTRGCLAILFLRVISLSWKTLA